MYFTYKKGTKCPPPKNISTDFLKIFFVGLKGPNFILLHYFFYPIQSFLFYPLYHLLVLTPLSVPLIYTHFYSSLFYPYFTQIIYPLFYAP